MLMATPSTSDSLSSNRFHCCPALDRSSVEATALLLDGLGDLGHDPQPLPGRWCLRRLSRRHGRRSGGHRCVQQPDVTTLVAAVSGKLNPKVNLVDTLNGGQSVFAPVDDARSTSPAHRRH
jgi:hypothetical protein